ncbi:MAG: hypothetical protein A2340_11725 [Lentisphaerae bacterium RIFOXYB12_FULL_60_10]|nr:MAG: hypothetical protein A2340_11725 [Lentisphaerae bacterium RIFOXYB12_FULL_60_10]
MQARFRYPWLPVFLADFAATTLAYYLAWCLRFHSVFAHGMYDGINRLLGVDRLGSMGWELELFYLAGAPRIILLLTATLVVIYALRHLYAGRRLLQPRMVAWEVIGTNVTALLLFYAYFYLRRNTFHPRSFFATLMILNTGFTILFRAGADRWLAWLRTRGMDRIRAIVAGSGEWADRVTALITAAPHHGIEVVGRIPADVPGVLPEAVRRTGAGMLLLVEPQLPVSGIMEWLDKTRDLDLETKVLSNALNVVVDQAGIPSDRIRGIPFLHFDAPSRAAHGYWIKRGISLLLALALMLVMSPLLAVIALFIRLTSRGPALYVQDRIGADGEFFRMYKFRTMVLGADEQQEAVEPLNDSVGGLFKIRRDPRVTPVGRLLRRFSLDELPQLINVVRGEMALVGPRPLPRRDVERFHEPWHYSRQEGLPGLTCLWQVSGRSELGLHDMCVLDLYYLRNQNWILDLQILLRTIGVVLFARGAY